MAAKAWTDAEKVGLLFQIIEKSGPIPWDDLTLPEGRTKKAVQVMVDKEKQKIKKLKAGGTEGEEGTKKREAEDGGMDEESPKKKPAKPKTPRKKKAAAKAEADADANADAGEEAVTAEPKEDEQD